MLVASSASLISNKSGEPGGADESEDSDSLDDDPDVNKFNEDGSFIGVYGQDQNTEDNADDDDDARLLANDTPNNGTQTNGTVPVTHTQNTFL